MASVRPGGALVRAPVAQQPHVHTAAVERVVVAVVPEPVPEGVPVVLVGEGSEEHPPPYDDAPGLLLASSD